jgi:hypothetical protein
VALLELVDAPEHLRCPTDPLVALAGLAIRDPPDLATQLFADRKTSSLDARGMRTNRCAPLTVVLLTADTALLVSPSVQRTGLSATIRTVPFLARTKGQLSSEG